MRIYVASSYYRKEDVKLLMEVLKLAGHTITFDWTTDENQAKAIGAPQAAKDDLRGVLDSEAVIVLHDDRGRGMCSEFGIALGANEYDEDKRRLIVIGSRHVREDGQRENIFYHHPDVVHVDTYAQVLEALA